ncbi:MAG: nitrilase-related carbon-nitrogen hydrolase [Fimbriimonadales bacterium]
MSFVVACAQMAPLKAQIEENLNLIAELALQAVGEGADLVVYPETAVTGYFLEGGVLELSLTAADLAARLAPKLASASKPVDLLIGFIERDSGNLYNSAAYIEASGGSAKVNTVYRKFFLPTYGVFDEERFVSRGNQVGVVDTRFGRLGILICEDVWHSILPTLAAVAGAKAMLIPSASPGRGFSGESVGNLERYERMLRAVCEEHGVFCVNTQLTGFEGGKGFVGGSRIMDPFGKVLVQAPVQEQALVMATIDLDLVDLARSQTPLISDLQSVWPTIERLAGSIAEI